MSIREIINLNPLLSRIDYFYMLQTLINDRTSTVDDFLFE